MRAMTTMRVETDRMMPKSIRKERILWLRKVSSATPIGSRSNSRRFMREVPLSVVRPDRGKGFRLAAWYRFGTARLRNVTTICGCLERGAKPGIGKLRRGRHLGAFAGVCYTNWAGSGIV